MVFGMKSVLCCIVKMSIKSMKSVGREEWKSARGSIFLYLNRQVSVDSIHLKREAKSIIRGLVTEIHLLMITIHLLYLLGGNQILREAAQEPHLW